MSNVSVNLFVPESYVPAVEHLKRLSTTAAELKERRSRLDVQFDMDDTAHGPIDQSTHVGLL